MREYTHIRTNSAAEERRLFRLVLPSLYYTTMVKKFNYNRRPVTGFSHYSLLHDNTPSNTYKLSKQFLEARRHHLAEILSIRL